MTRVERLASCVALSICICAFIAHAEVDQRHSASGALSTLRSNLRNHKIERIEILAIPVLMAVGSYMTEEDLASSAFYRCELDKGQPIFGALTRVVQEVKLLPPDGPPDVRWGIIFFGVDGKPLSSIYLSQDISGPKLNAKIDGQLTAVDKPIFHWLRVNTPFNGCERLRRF